MLLPMLLTALALSAPVRAGTDDATAVQQVLDDLQVVQALSQTTVTPATRKEILSRLDHMKVTLETVKADLLRAPASSSGASVNVSVPGMAGFSYQVQISDDAGGGFASAPTLAPAPPRAMDPGAFTQLKNALANEGFNDGRQTVLRQAVSTNWFTCRQVLEILPLFDFSKDRVDAAALLYPRVTDKENFFQVYGAFDFDSDKQALKKRLGL